MWKAVVKLWKEDLTFAEFCKEIQGDKKNGHMFIQYLVIVCAILVGLSI